MSRRAPAPSRPQVRVRPRSMMVLVLGTVSLAGCTVDDGFLDQRLFPCSGPGDCGEDWACVRASPYATDFCAPSCKETSCDGICVRQKQNDVERELCLRGCRIHEDGSTSGCPGKGYSCIRVSVESDDGVCYPVDSCDTSEECDSGELCLSELTAPVAPSFKTDNFYCVPEPADDGSCPPRSTPIALNDSTSLCLATCDPPDTRCPPGSGCLQQLSVVSPEMDVPCFPGLYGVPCDDNTNCLFGQCTDVGDPGRICTITCDEAARLAGGCRNLFSLEYLSPVFQMECDPTANGGKGGGLCVTRYNVGFVCTTPDSNAYQCVERLDCRTFTTDDGEVRICTKDCSRDADCNESSERALAYCRRSGAGESGVCLPKGGEGASCSSDRQCLSGSCTDNACDGEGS